MNRLRKATRAGFALAGLLGLVAGASANPFGGILFRGTTPVDTFPGESCTQCHRNGTLDRESSMVEILVDGSSASEYAYTPGETVSLVMNFTDTEAKRLGFLVMTRSGAPVSTDSEIICGTGGTMEPGTSAAGATVKVRNGAFLSRKPEPCGDLLDDVWWATHTRPTNGTSASWEVAWTLPTESVGPITLLFMGNGGDGVGTSGDNILTKLLTVDPAGPTEPPAITGGGYVLAGLGIEDETAQGAPSAIASVNGTDFVSSGLTSSSPLDDSGKLATVVDGTCVEIGGMHRAPLLQVSPENVTFQIPSDVGVGDSNVKVIRDCDTDDSSESNSVDFTVAAVRPVFLQFSENTSGLAALRPNIALVASAGSVEGRRTRPAVAGDVVHLFGTGFGPVDPAYSAGEVASELRSLESTALRVMLGETELDAANVLYAGSAPNFAGIYQLILEIPENASTGSHNFSVFVDSVQSLAGPKLEVATPASLLPTNSCTVGLVLNSSERCLATFSGSTGILEVDADGKACVLGSTDDLDTWVCDADSLDLGEYGAAISKNPDGSWTVSTLPQSTTAP